MGDSNLGENTVVVTGALSYTGKYTTQILLRRGFTIRTLTHHPERPNPFGDKVRIFPYRFNDPDHLAEVFRGASALINTYWVRFPRGKSSYESAVQNSYALINAAKNAGVRRIVHVSIANPSLQSPLGYYKGKAQLEQAVLDSGLSYTILRPTVIFGLEDILINNIAWFVRHFPLFGIPGDGRYRIRPIYVEDMAQLMADAVEESTRIVFDAVGPETFTFEELVRCIASQLHRSIHIIHLPLLLAYLSTSLVGCFIGDTVLTLDEYRGLMSDLLASDSPASGKTHLSQWLAENYEHIGKHYASEVARHYGKPTLRS
jgi:uncharacterized protein YbjT (DUF2867 family)